MKINIAFAGTGRRMSGFSSKWKCQGREILIDVLNMFFRTKFVKETNPDVWEV